MKIPYIIATLVYCAGIFWESSQSRPVKTDIHFAQDDKVAHILLYGGLTAVVSLGIRRSGKPAKPAWQFWAPIVFATLYGISDEFHQRFVPMRSCDIFDVMADTTGATLAQIVLCGWAWKIFRRSEHA